jgi:hypothetical protein
VWKVAELYFDKLYILDPVGAGWATIGADRHVCKAVMHLKDANILQTVPLADARVKYIGPITDAIRRDMHDWEFLKLCEVRSGRWTLSLCYVLDDPQTDQVTRHPMGRALPKGIAVTPAASESASADFANSPSPVRWITIRSVANQGGGGCRAVLLT